MEFVPFFAFHLHSVVKTHRMLEDKPCIRVRWRVNEGGYAGLAWPLDERRHGRRGSLAARAGGGGSGRAMLSQRPPFSATAKRTGRHLPPLTTSPFREAAVRGLNGTGRTLLRLDEPNKVLIVVNGLQRQSCPAPLGVFPQRHQEWGGGGVQPRRCRPLSSSLRRSPACRVRAGPVRALY